MNTTEHVVEAVGLVKRRGDFTLGPLDLRVPRGFVTGMVGANGSGKTTTLRTLLGLVRADAGRIAMPPIGEVGVVFDQPFVLPYWRVRDAAAAYAASRSGWDQDWFDRLCRRFRLGANERVNKLSRGQGNKLMTALSSPTVTGMFASLARWSKRARIVRVRRRRGCAPIGRG